MLESEKLCAADREPREQEINFVLKCRGYVPPPTLAVSISLSSYLSALPPIHAKFSLLHFYFSFFLFQ